MKYRVYHVVDGAAATIAPAEQMVRCHDCGIVIAPPIRRQRADDIVAYQGRSICVRCGMHLGIVRRDTAEAADD